MNDEICFRKVCYYNGKRYIKDDFGWPAYLGTKEMYIIHGLSAFTSELRKYHPDIADQLDLEQGSGVFAVDRPFDSIADNCRAMIRYSNGEQQEVILSELLCWEEFSS